ncbi:uncharacterized protein LOC122530709 isoform X3 [Frieseomelitta varia]|uniref:uncharacterized protein LOC122530709 isoform X3 n=1 Tax=Frieseomelitta varia TaxID=561572 RepID=UPI001CB6862E|nr:uncharacterized protein LOC122530709 isoform X3 [Frieseomelitta varia]
MAGKMAAAELKRDNVSCYETVKKNVSAITLHREIECYQFKLLDLFYYVASVSFFFIDIATDSIVFMGYFLQGEFVWGCFALCFAILPAAVIQMFSLRWYHSDGSIKNIHWLLHFLFLGVLHRYLILLCSTIYSLRSKRFVKDKNWVYRQESDICMLHLFESFMGAAPQLILQLYIMAVLRYTPLWTSLSAIVSFCSLSWAVGTYTKAMHRINPGHNEATWIVLTLQGLWRAGMLISRIAVLVLTAVCLREWSLLFLGFHWLSMTIWVLLQNTDFCPTVWEERIYNCIIGFIYCFDFFNLRVGRSRYRVFVFYSVIVIENIAFLIVFVLCFKDAIKAEEMAVMASLIIGGMIIGLTSMLFYYGKFHPSRVGGLPNVAEGKSVPVTNKAATPRSFKQYYPNSFASSSCSIDHSRQATSEEITTDKQYLLTNIVQNSDCTESGVVNQTCQIESEPAATAIRLVSECEPAHNVTKDETASTGKNTFPVAADNVACEYLEIQSDCNDSSEKDIHRQKRRGICLPTSHGLLDMDKDVVPRTETPNACLPLQKRRGICFSSQLILEMENEDKVAQEKVAANRNLASTKCDELKERPRDGNMCEGRANSIAMLRERLETPTTFNEKITSTEKLTKELQQRDETMSCVTSIHDYENVCPLGVARPPWCIRSWKGYTDIETYIHDDSVVRDRRRDTLTSTTTGTTYSSEFSDTTCASSLLRGILKQDDYLDTLTYDLIDNNDDLAGKRVSSMDEQNPTLYIAKPVVIDDKGGMFALDTILEEHDEIAADEKFEYSRSGSDSVSTLVSTIDQIRRYTAENSPRHVYHTTGSQWEDFDPKNLIKRAQLTRALFNGDAATCNRNYINRLDNESESIQVRGKREIDAIGDLVKYCTTIESFKKTPLIDAILSDSPILGSKAKPQKQNGPIACRKDEFDSKENDLYVEMSPLVPVENVKVVHNNFTVANVSSTAARLNADDNGGEKLETMDDKRRKPINYPRRKFSLLKEKFESKSQLVYVVTPSNAIKIEQSAASSEVDPSKRNVSVILKKSSDCTKCDKENLAPAATFRAASHEKNDRSHSNVLENDESLCGGDLNLKERRHMFLEQVLSPPKLLTWSKRKSLSGSTVKKPA